MFIRRLGRTPGIINTGGGVVQRKKTAWGLATLQTNILSVRASSQQQYGAEYDDQQYEGNFQGTADRTTTPNMQFTDAANLQEWTHVFNNRNGRLNDRDCTVSLKAVAKLLKKEGKRAPPEVKENVTLAIESIFVTSREYLDDMPPFVQASLLSNIASLGVFFGNSYEWREFGPGIPVFLMDPALDNVISKLDGLRPFHLALLLTSLEKLKLDDEDAYSRIVDQIIVHLNSKDDGEPENSIRKPSTLSMISNSLAKIVSEMPHVISQRQQQAIFEQLAATATELARSSASEGSHRAFATIGATFAALPASVEGEFFDLFDSISQYILKNLSTFNGGDLSIAATAFCSGKHADEKTALAIADTMQHKLDECESNVLARSATAFAHLPSPPKELLRNITWECLTRVPATRVETTTEALCAAVKGGAATPDLLATALNTHQDISTASHSPSIDRATWNMLEALRVSGHEAPGFVDAAQNNVCNWMQTSKMRLWRIVPYMKLFAASEYNIQTFMECAMLALSTEGRPERTEGNLEALLIEALQACITIGDAAACNQILDMNYLVDKMPGTSSQRFTQVLSHMAPAARAATNANVDPVWRRVLDSGLDSSRPELVANCAIALRLGHVQPSVWAPHVLRALQIPTDAMPSEHHPMQYLTPAGLIDLLEAFMPQDEATSFWTPDDTKVIADGLTDIIATVALASPNATSALVGSTPLEQALSTIKVLRDSLKETKRRSTKSAATVAGADTREANVAGVDERKPANGDTALRDESADASVKEPSVTASSLQALKIAELKVLLKEQGLPVTGKKADLIQRLLQSREASDIESQTDESASEDGSGNEAADRSSDDEFSTFASDSDSEPIAVSDEYDKMKVVELKNACRQQNLQVTGTKKVLLMRLRDPTNPKHTKA